MIFLIMMRGRGWEFNTRIFIFFCAFELLHYETVVLWHFYVGIDLMGKMEYKKKDLPRCEMLLLLGEEE